MNPVWGDWGMNDGGLDHRIRRDEGMQVESISGR